MMKNLKIVLAIAVFLIGTVCIVSDSQARVCFATDSDCDTGVEFYDQNSNDELKQRCIEEGYTQTSCPSGDFKYNCPYKTTMLKCCSQDYGYTNCSYPLVKDGKCGGKYRCKCDNNKYKYSFDGFTGSSKCVNNSTPGGTSCVHQVLNASGNGLDLQTFYTECRCDRALFPYTVEMCDSKAEHGDECKSKDIKGNSATYFSTCYCDRKIYPYSFAGCSPFVGDETKGKCTSGGTTYYKSCKTCSGYPADNLDHVAYNPSGTPDPQDYEVCPYRQIGNSYKIKACREPGYKVNSDGSACVPISCEEAVKMFVKTNTSYGLFTGYSLVNENGQSVNRSKAVVAKDITATGKSCSTSSVRQKRCKKFCCKYKLETKETNTADEIAENSDEEDEIDEDDVGDWVVDPSCTSAGVYDAVEANVSVPTNCYNEEYMCSSIGEGTYSITTGYIGCTSASTYDSAYYLSKQLSATSDGVKAMKVACTTVPTVTYSGTSFPNNSSTAASSYIDTYGLDLKFSAGSAASNVNLSIYNGSLLFNTLTLNKSTALSTVDVAANDAELKVKGGNLHIRNSFTSKARAYDVSGVLSVKNALTTPVFFDGSGGKNFKVGSDFQVDGIVGFKDYSIYANNAHIAHNTSKSGVSMYNSSWYVWERDTYKSNQIHIKSMGYIGTPASCNDGAFATGSKIIFSNDRVYKALACRDKRYNGEDNSDCVKQIGTVYYVNERGYASSYGCSGSGKKLLCAGAGHHHSGSGYMFDMNGTDIYTWNHNHGCGACVY